MTDEIWRPIIGYEGRYEVSNVGRVRRIAPGQGARAGQIIRAQSTPYAAVTLSDSNLNRKKWRIHHLVLEAFICRRPPELECRHLDGNNHNNALTNLAWGTRTENAHDQIVHGTWTHGENHSRARLTEDIIREAHQLRAAGATIKSIAERYGVHRETIGKALRGSNWAHLQPQVALTFAEHEGYSLQTNREEN